MADNLFNTGMNDANIAFGVDCGEEFEVLTGGIQATLMALSIESVTQESKLVAGGNINVGDIILYVLKSVWDGAEIKDGAKLLIRGKRYRFSRPEDDGDNCYVINCGPTGVQL